MSKGQLKGPCAAPGFAKETGAPPIAKSHERAQAKATDPSRWPAPNRGQTATSKGGRGKGSGKE